jgi:sporulation protein YunB
MEERGCTMSGFRTHKKGFFSKRHLFLLSLIIFTIISFQGYLIVERNLEPALKGIADTYVKQIATLTINDAVSKKIAEDMSETKKFIEVEKDANGRVTLITFDHAKQARVVTQVTQRANEELMKLSKEPIKIPMGQALDSNIFAQLGPDVPITLVPMGAAKADVEVKMEESGINVVTLTVILKIEADVRIVIPFTSKEAVVSTELPIESIVLPGEVPNVYFKNGDGNVSPIPMTIPLEQTK